MQLVLRRILAVIVALGLPALAVGALVLGSDTHDHYKDLVETAPRQIATIVDVREQFRGNSEYEVESNGNRFTLGHSEAVDELNVGPGDTIEYVIDTVDPLWTIGVGDPAYWEPHPVLDAILSVGLVGCSLIIAIPAVNWLLPAGFERSRKGSTRTVRGKHAAEKPSG